MIPTITRDATHNFQAPANWQPDIMGECGDLLVRAELVGETNVVEMVSTWKPSVDELALLNKGFVIEIGLCLATQPAMRAYVVPPVDQPPTREKAGITINEEAHGDDYDANVELD